MNKYLKYVITIVLTALAVTGFILFEIAHISLVNDQLTNNLLGRTIYYYLIIALFLWLAYLLRNSPYISIKHINKKVLLWCLPCLLVAIVNFPFFSLISGDFYFDRLDLLPLYIFYVIGIAVLEEYVFRGIVLFLFLEIFRRQKFKYFLAALVSSLIFALFHLSNIFVGMDVGSALLQVLYTFLIGGMLSVTAFKGKSIWPCVVIHAIFDFGGLIYMIASVDPWADSRFWILTIVCGILCAGHIIVSLINLERKYVS